MDAEQLIQRLREEAAEVGGIVKWAQSKKVPASIVSDIMNGRREPTPQVLVAMGLVLIKDYQPMKGI